MEFINNFNEDVYFFVYDVGDLIYAMLVRDPTLPPLVPARKEFTVLKGTRASGISHPDGFCHVGVKHVGVAGFGRLDPFLAPLTPDVYDDSAQFELTPSGELRWLNAPVLPNPTPRLPLADLMTPLPKAKGLVVGVGKARITDLSIVDPNSRLPMQGWADPSQATGGRDDTNWELMARAFIVADPATRTRTVLVVADIWSCSIAMKQEVVRRLGGANPEMPYRAENIWIAGTHTHSAPAGFLHHFLYNAMAFGFDAHVFESVVTGIVAAIEAAHLDLAPGRVLANAGSVPTLTRNRSLPAFLLNPTGDRAAFPSGVDDRMTLLRFEHGSGAPGAKMEAIGALNWFAIHPTNRGKKNTLVTGDNKGWAAHTMEAAAMKLPQIRKGFVAAFANSCCGDVSGNFAGSRRTFDSVEGGTQADFDKHRKRMIASGNAQSRAALDLFQQATTVLSGPVRAVHQQVDMEKRTGVPAAIGLSMTAGSVEDGGPGVFPEGVTLLDPRQPTLTSLGLTSLGIIAQPIAFAIQTFVSALSALLNPTSLRAHLSALASSLQAQTAMVALHFPKPLFLMPGLMRPDPWVPNVLEFQMIRIGQFALLGVPAEVTTVAGLRLRRAALAGLSGSGIESVVVGTYANGYASYVTTPEEYAAQHYEGASTLFGPLTCPTMEAAVTDVARALATGVPIADDAPSPDLRTSVLMKPRMTFRNETTQQMRFRLYAAGDSTYTWLLWPGADFVVAPGTDRAVIIPALVSLGVFEVQVVAGGAALTPGTVPTPRVFASTDDLVVAMANGTLARSRYFPTARAV